MHRKRRAQFFILYVFNLKHLWFVFPTNRLYTIQYAIAYTPDGIIISLLVIVISLVISLELVITIKL